MYGVTTYNMDGTVREHHASATAAAKAYGVCLSTISRVACGHLQSFRLSDGIRVTIRRGLCKTPIEPLVHLPDGRARAGKPVTVYNADGTIFGSYSTGKAAAKALNMASSGVVCSCATGRFPYLYALGGQRFFVKRGIHTESMPPPKVIYKKRLERPITCFTSDGNVLKQYSTVREALRDLGLNAPSVHDVLKNVRKSTSARDGRGITFRDGYHTDPIEPFTHKYRAPQRRKQKV